MLSGSLCGQNFLYVAPTRRLIDQTARNIRSAIQKHSGMFATNVFLIHSEHRHDEDTPTAVEALEVINGTDAKDGRIVIVTTTTFLSILARIQHKERWRVILDEGFSPVEFLRFHLGSRPEEGWDYLQEAFTIVPELDYRIVPVTGYEERVREIASGDLKRAGDHSQGLQRLAQMVANPARRNEVVQTRRAKMMMDARFGMTECPVPDNAADSGDQEGSVLLIASYVTPDHFRDFTEVVFMAALFDRSILYHLWTRQFGVRFDPHPFFKHRQLRDTHREQGPLVAIGHLLHRDDTTSKVNLSRNTFTGEPDEQEPGLRVIDQMIITAAECLKAQPFLLQVNDCYGYTSSKCSLLPENAIKIPTLSHGLNDYQECNAVVALAVTNPNPQETTWLMERTGLSHKESLMALRLHTTYQAVGRSSIRSRPGNHDKKVFLVAGYEDAKFLHELFPGSKWLGQVGKLPPLASLQMKDKEDGITSTTAKLICGFLESSPPEIESVSSRTLKATLAPEVKKRTWARATEKAAQEVTGWARRGGSFVRLTFESFFGEDCQAVTAEEK